MLIENDLQKSGKVLALHMWALGNLAQRGSSFPDGRGRGYSCSLEDSESAALELAAKEKGIPIKGCLDFLDPVDILDYILPFSRLALKG